MDSSDGSNGFCSNLNDNSNNCLHSLISYLMDSSDGFNGFCSNLNDNSNNTVYILSSVI